MLNDRFFLDIQRIHLAHEFVLNSVQKCEYPIRREHYGLVYVLKGNAEYRFSDGEKITVTDGNVLFLSSWAAYSIVTEKEFEHYTVNFDIHEKNSRFDSLDRAFCLLCEPNTEHIKKGFIKLLSAWSQKKSGFEMQAIGHLYQLLSLFYFEYRRGKDTQIYQRLLPVKEYIECNFDEPISLDRLARLVDMSVTNFRREWKKLYGESPLQYRDDLRLSYAKEYLNSGYYSVSEIAHKCGFDDVSYFVRFFKKQTGITPGDFKKHLLRK